MEFCKGDSNFWVCGRNPMEWPFKWNLSTRTYTWCDLFFKISQNEMPLAAFGSERVNTHLISHYRVAQSLCFKARLSTKPLGWKWFLIPMQKKLIITGKNLHLASFWKWGFFELGNSLVLQPHNTLQSLLIRASSFSTQPFLTEEELCVTRQKKSGNPSSIKVAHLIQLYIRSSSTCKRPSMPCVSSWLSKTSLSSWRDLSLADVNEDHKSSQYVKRMEMTEIEISLRFSLTVASPKKKNTPIFPPCQLGKLKRSCSCSLNPAEKTRFFPCSMLLAWGILYLFRSS